MIGDITKILTEKDIPHKNYIINGNFDFWQRGISGQVVGSSVYTADRFGVSSGLFTTTNWEKSTKTDGSNVLKHTFTSFTHGNSIGKLAEDVVISTYQRIEDLKSTANKSFTVSFDAKASIHTDIQVKFSNVYGQESSVSVTSTTGSRVLTINGASESLLSRITPNITCVVNASNLAVFNGDVGGTVISKESNTITLSQAAIAGATFTITLKHQSTLTPVVGAHVPNDGEFHNVTCTIDNSYIFDSTLYSYYNTNNGTYLQVDIDTVGILVAGSVEISKVQVTEGLVATPFEYRPIAEELSLCQRYYESGTVLNGVCTLGTASGTPKIIQGARYAVVKRTTPTVRVTATHPTTAQTVDTLWRITDALNESSIIAYAVTVGGGFNKTDGFHIVPTPDAAGALFIIGHGYFFYFTADAEL